MPLRARDGTFARADLVQHLGALPIVETHEPARVARHHELAVGAHAHVDGVPGAVVAPEDLLAVLPEAVGAGVHDDLVVGGLEGDGFVGGVRGGADQRVHVRFGDAFDGDGDANFPGQDRFVVRGGYHAAVRVDECNC